MGRRSFPVPASVKREKCHLQLKRSHTSTVPPTGPRQASQGGQGEMPLLDPSFLYKKINSKKKSLQDIEILSVRAELCITALVGIGRWVH